MKVENGKFYFIKDEFFDIFKDYKLMENKENGNKRPCYFCFNDPENQEIIWFVPISSKVDKYKVIYENKKKVRKTVYNFVFGNVLGKEKAFLIQNIFPTTEKYIESKYQNKMQDVEITEVLKREVIQASMNVIKLAKKGINIPFYDIIEMKNILLRRKIKMNKEELQEVIEYLVNKNISDVEEYSVEINNGKPFFSKSDYKIIEGEPKYFELDEEGRCNGAIAIVTSNTIPLLVNKNLKYLPPYGWSDTIHNNGFFEQCHIIAYSLSARFTNRKNVFIGTEYLNTSIMAHWENKAKDQIKKYNDRILYRVTMKYKGKNQIPTGILIEAQSLENEFCLCEFCYNIQPGVNFNYTDGTIIKDNRTINEIEEIKERQLKNTRISEINIEEETKPKRTGIWKDYIVNRKTNTYHLR